MYEQIMKTLRDVWESENVSVFDVCFSWVIFPLFSKLNPMFWFGKAAFLALGIRELFIVFFLFCLACVVVPLEWIALYLYITFTVTIRAIMNLPRTKTHYGFGAAALALWSFGIFLVMPFAHWFFAHFGYDVSWKSFGEYVNLI